MASTLSDWGSIHALSGEEPGILIGVGGKLIAQNTTLTLYNNMCDN